MKIEINIQMEGNNLSEKEKAVLMLLAGNTTAAEIKMPNLANMPKPEVKLEPEVTPEPEIKPEPKAHKKPKAKKALQEEIIEDVVEEEESMLSHESDMTMTREELNNYARDNAKAEYAPHYRAILAEYGVSKFKEIPEDKVLDAKAAIDKIIATVK